MGLIKDREVVVVVSDSFSYLVVGNNIIRHDWKNSRGVAFDVAIAQVGKQCTRVARKLVVRVATGFVHKFGQICFHAR